MTNETLHAPQVRLIGMVNWIGLWTLICKEIERFVKAYRHTLLAPAILTMLMFIVFQFSIGATDHTITISPYPKAMPFLSFLAPGLIIMAILQNAFSNPSGSLINAKVQGNIVDVLMSPLSPFELTVGYMIGGIVRGVLSGILISIPIALIGEMEIYNPLYILFHAVMGAMLMSILGLIGGIWAQKYDHMANIHNFALVPITFLSGTFFVSDQLPGIAKMMVYVNPFFYIIDGFRYGFIGMADSVLALGFIIVVVANLSAFFIAYHLFSCGWRLKS